MDSLSLSELKDSVIKQPNIGSFSTQEAFSLQTTHVWSNFQFSRHTSIPFCLYLSSASKIETVIMYSECLKDVLFLRDLLKNLL